MILVRLPKLWNGLTLYTRYKACYLRTNNDVHVLFDVVFPMFIRAVCFFRKMVSVIGVCSALVS